MSSSAGRRLGRKDRPVFCGYERRSKGDPQGKMHHRKTGFGRQQSARGTLSSVNYRRQNRG